MTHDYKRNGTLTLFAALNTLSREVLGTCAKRHRHQEWLTFLKMINKQIPADKDIHIIYDNYSTHKHPKVRSWLRYHKQVHVYLTPTSASWLNMVELFYRELTDKQLRLGVFKSVQELEQTVLRFIDSHNKAPAPFIWTKSARDILEKVTRGRKKPNKLHSVWRGTLAIARKVNRVSCALLYALLSISEMAIRTGGMQSIRSVCVEKASANAFHA